MTLSSPIIDIQHLSKIYKAAQQPALDDINLQIPASEIFGLLGPNGAGKTTMISILCGLLKPSRGQVLISGLALEKEIRKIKAIIGIVPQDIALYHKLTARENLRYFGRMYGLSGDLLEERLTQALMMLGLDQRADDTIDTFSGGMKRRTNLIAGILHKPQILFLDEPTVGVDVQSRKVILDHLSKLQKEGMTIVYTSHDLKEAENFCTWIAIIDQGKILIQGSPSELTGPGHKSDNLEKLFIALTGHELKD